MTIKNFFKSNAFKCIAVMMSIVIICGGIIAICNDIFYVSPEEVTMRAVTSIFGKEPDEMQELVVTDSQAEENAGGYVSSSYMITDSGNTYLLINSTGNNGFKGGDVTMWTLLNADDISCSDDNEYVSSTITGIESIQYSSNNSQSFIGLLTSTYYDGFTSYDEIVSNGGYFTTSLSSSTTTDITDGTVVSPVSGATWSSMAVVNAINSALYYAYGGTN